MILYHSKKFGKQFKKLPENLRSAFDSRVRLFLIDKYHPALNNHLLRGEYFGCSSINITGDYRAIFRESDSGQAVIFLEIGDHHQLYGK